MSASSAILSLISDPRWADADRTACFKELTGNTSSRIFTLGTTSAVNAVPTDWDGRYVRIRSQGGKNSFYFTTDVAGVAVVPVVGAATAAGFAAATVAEGPFEDKENVEVRIPKAATGETMYFVRISDTNGIFCTMTLADGTRGLTGP